MSETLYPAYRSYVRSRVEVNDAMTALLAGARLAAHTLQLTAGSSHTLKDVFPAVEHISRFNLRSDDARSFLLDADHHLASVAIPYALATHEDYVTGALQLLKSNGRSLTTHGKQIRAWNMHTILFETCGAAEPAEWMQSFHVLRELRNCITHAGGEASSDLTDLIAAMGANARAGWAGINLGASPESIVQGGSVVLSAELIFTAFAVTKRLGRAINETLSDSLTDAEWAKVVVTDFADQTRKPKNSSGWRRSLLGYSRQNYARLAITEASLEVASRELGMWSRARWMD
ncbi:hypothetical protein [Microbacterium sp. SORGH_AS_0888]|uniref:hypothetical protein n=1 Tax=Microbacterium sp. SORGH_AS_0888 TaxID=3041791 RepID=UPI002789FEFF|nr:hypothetical protein [Microbacterium sp. SORGH_AS_0888]MDQ1130067.1 hypothetical protein [Microbacterium sp. SORGH_AS_0888]